MPPILVLQFLGLMILFYFTLLNSIYLVFTVIAFFDLLRFDRRSRRRKLGDVISGTTFRPISIIVPAYNEQETVVDNVRSVLEVGYPEFEIIVVNDGSQDETLLRLQKEFSLFPIADATREQLPTQRVHQIYRSLDHPNLIVLDKESGGKSDALNAGINASNYPLFCAIDADSLLNSDALLRIARAFVEDERIVAAGGIVRVLNGAVMKDGRVIGSRAPTTFLVLCQTIEYLRGFLTGRTALAKMNSLLNISGAFGLFLKRAVIQAGGYDTKNVGEDMELVVRLHRIARENRKEAKVIFVPDPVCWTQVPSDLESLLRQRDRWQRGLVESLSTHGKMFVNPRYGSVGMFAYPFYLFFEALGPVFEVLGYLLIPVLWYFGVLDITFLWMFVTLAILYSFALSLAALLIDDLLFQRYDRARDLGKMMLGALLEFFGYRQILADRRTVSFFTALFTRQKWGHIERKPIAES